MKFTALVLFLLCFISCTGNRDRYKYVLYDITYTDCIEKEKYFDATNDDAALDSGMIYFMNDIEASDRANLLYYQMHKDFIYDENPEFFVIYKNGKAIESCKNVLKFIDMSQALKDE